jgi:hypothetical protein
MSTTRNSAERKAARRKIADKDAHLDKAIKLAKNEIAKLTRKSGSSAYARILAQAPK